MINTNELFLISCLLIAWSCGSNKSSDTGGIPAGLYKRHPLPAEILYAPGALSGYWVWSKEVTDGEVTLEILPPDLEPTNGEMPWEGCPAGISCTHHGIKRVVFTNQGNAFFGLNVVTGSDWNTLSTFSVDHDVVENDISETYSCAHPNDDNQKQSTQFSKFARDDDKLWISAAAADKTKLPDSRDSGSWIVYRPISESDFFGPYRILQSCYADRSDRGACHAACRAEPTPI